MALQILLVEDNADTRYLLAYLIVQAGHAVREAGSVQAARVELAARMPDVLVTDIGLPDGSGYELLQGLPRDARRPFAIAMSGFGTAADIEASRAIGFRHHMVKPIEIDALEALLAQAEAQLAPPDPAP